MFTEELRASTDWDGPINALLGAFYFNEKINQSNQLQLGTQFRPYADFQIQGASGGAFNLSQVEQVLSAASGQNYIGKSFKAGNGFTENYHLTDESFSVFGQVDFKVTDRLTLTGGINYTHDTKNFATNSQSTEVFSAIPLGNRTLQGNVTNVLIAQQVAAALEIPVTSVTPAIIGNFAGSFPGPFGQIAAGSAAATQRLLGLRALQFLPPFLNLPNALETGHVSDGHWTFTARAAFDATDTVNVYASYATGYKAASVNLSRDSRPTLADYNTIQSDPTYAALRLANLSYGSRYAGPEKSTVYEAGLKGNWGVATANVAVFKQTIRGFQSNIFTGLGFFLANAGKQSSFGVEFEGTVKPTSALTISFAMTYLDPKYDDFKLSGETTSALVGAAAIVASATIAMLDKSSIRSP